MVIVTRDRTDWPYNEVGKIPRGPSSLGAPKAIGAPHHHDLFFGSTSVWTGAFALFSSYLMTSREPLEKKSHQKFGMPILS
jgi:hypothetical protein